jgi:hypothetical protein
MLKVSLLLITQRKNQKEVRKMIKINDLVKTAKETGSEESVVTVDKKKDYKIGVGIRLRKRNKVEVFTAASIQLGVSDDCSVDLERLTRTVGVLWKFRDLGYCICYCGNGSIYVERETKEDDVKKNVVEMQKLLVNGTINDKTEIV